MGDNYFENVVVGGIMTAGPYRVTRDEMVEYAEKWDPFPFHEARITYDIRRQYGRKPSPDAFFSHVICLHLGQPAGEIVWAAEE